MLQKFGYQLLEFMCILVIASDDRAGANVSSTFVWNIRIDYGSMAIRTVGIHAIIVSLMDKHFGKLIDSLNETENLLSVTMSEQEHRRHCSKYRRLCFTGITYIIITVC